MNHKKIKIVLIAAISGVFGSLLVYPFSEFLINNKYILLSFIAGGLLYTALSDIYPNFKSKGFFKAKIIYLLFILFGIILFFLFEELTHLH